MTTADSLIVRNVPARYGLHVLELGEDGGTLVVLGHHDDRRTLAALNHYARDVWGSPLETPRPLLLEDVKRVRGIVVHSCHRGWAAEDDRPASELELADLDAAPCQDCLDEVGAEWALLYRDDAQDHPAAFPVTVWEYDS